MYSSRNYLKVITARLQGSGKVLFSVVPDCFQGSGEIPSKQVWTGPMSQK